MSDEILTHDQIVLHRERAWHGKGIIVQDEQTPREALVTIGADYPIVQMPLVAISPFGSMVDVPNKVANVRADIDLCLGVVSPNYKPIQNSELADFAEALAEQGDVVKIESAGTIRNGGKIWFLLKGESFSVMSDDDVVMPYICVSNGHDGGTALRATPTTIRVVCSNTLHMVIPRYESEGRRVKLDRPCFVGNHMGDVKAKVEAAKAALSLYGRSLDSTIGLIHEAASIDMSSEDVKRFFLTNYVRDFGAIPTNPTNTVEKKRLERSQDAWLAFLGRFETEIAGPNAWGAFNAYTAWSQWGRGKGATPSSLTDNQIGSHLFGLEADRAFAAFSTALAG